METTSTRRVDIAVMCHNAQTLVSLADPAKKLIVALDRFRKWESPILCVAAMIVTTAVCFLLPSVYFMLLNLTLLGSIASIGIAHLKGNILLKVLPRPIVADDYNNYLADLPEAQTHAEMMKQFKEILLYTDEAILGITKLIEKFYQIIKWEDFNHSLRCYSIAAVLVILLHILPLRWTITLFVDGFVLYHPLKWILKEKYFSETSEEDSTDCTTLQNQTETSFIPSEDEEVDEEDASSEHSSSDMSETEGMEFGGTEDMTNNDTGLPKVKQPEAVTSENIDSVAPEQTTVRDTDMDTLSYELEASSEVEPPQTDTIKKTEFQQLKGEVRSGSDGTDTGSDTGSIESNRLSTSPNRPTGVVGRIMEFKRKQQQANTGTCVGCGANFTTILKRKRNCNYCGNNFCAKCCSFKIPKSILGATAPGSLADQVAVCHECHNYLTASEKELADNKSKKMQE